MEEWRFIDFGLVDIRDMMAMDEAILKSDEGNTFFFWTPKKSSGSSIMKSTSSISASNR